MARMKWFFNGTIYLTCLPWRKAPGAIRSIFWMCLPRFCKSSGLWLGDSNHPFPPGPAWRPFSSHSYCQLFGFSLVPLSQDADRWYLSSLIPISCGCGLRPTTGEKHENNYFGPFKIIVPKEVSCLLFNSSIIVPCLCPRSFSDLAWITFSFFVHLTG